MTGKNFSGKAARRRGYITLRQRLLIFFVLLTLLELNREKLLNVLSEAYKKTPQQDPEEERSLTDCTILRQHLLREVICHFYEDPKNCSAKMAEAGIVFPERTLYCFLIKAGELYRFEDADDEEAHTLQIAMQNVAEDILRDCMDGYYVPGKTG